MKCTVAVFLAMAVGCSSRSGGADIRPQTDDVDAVEDVVEQVSDNVEPAPVEPPVDAVDVPEVIPDEAWELMDASVLSPMPTVACDSDVVDSWETTIAGYARKSARDAETADRMHKMALGCAESGNWEIAVGIAGALRRRDAEPIDGYVSATVAAARRAADSEPCGGGTLWDIVYNVNVAAGPEYSARMLANPNFEPVYNAYRWRLATMPGAGRTVERLTGTTWFNCGACGVYGDVYQYRLEADGVGVYRFGDPTEDGNGLVWSEVPITWTVDGNQVTITREGEQTTMTLDGAAGRLTSESGGAYRDHQDECSA